MLANGLPWTEVLANLAKQKRVEGLAAIKTAQGVYCDGAIEVKGDGLRVRWQHLREPQRVYEADFAWLTVRHGAVSLFFGKEDVNEPGKLRSRLEIRYPVEKFCHHLWDNSRDFHERLKKSPAWPANADRRGVEPETWKAQKDHSERANFEYMANYGSEASIDFYYLVPQGVARLAGGFGGDGLKMDPVVRVQLTAQELLHLLDQAEPLATTLAAGLPDEVRDDNARASDEEKDNQ